MRTDELFTLLDIFTEISITDSITADVEAVKQLVHVDVVEPVKGSTGDVQAGCDQLFSESVVDRFRHQLGAVELVVACQVEIEVERDLALKEDTGLFHDLRFHRVGCVDRINRPFTGMADERFQRLISHDAFARELVRLDVIDLIALTDTMDDA